jgi:hypothetical protein
MLLSGNSTSGWIIEGYGVAVVDSAGVEATRSTKINEK